MIEIRKYCLCGVSFRRWANDEDHARELVSLFRMEHTGAGHGPTDYAGCLHAVSRIVAARARAKNGRKPLPLITEMLKAEAKQDPGLHIWVNRFGLIVCRICLVVKPESGLVAECRPALVLYGKA